MKTNRLLAREHRIDWHSQVGETVLGHIRLDVNFQYLSEHGMRPTISRNGRQQAPEFRIDRLKPSIGIGRWLRAEQAIPS
jgi:hypothetical protein